MLQFGVTAKRATVRCDSSLCVRIQAIAGAAWNSRRRSNCGRSCSSAQLCNICVGVVVQCCRVYSFNMTSCGAHRGADGLLFLRFWVTICGFTCTGTLWLLCKNTSIHIPHYSRECRKRRLTSSFDTVLYQYRLVLGAKPLKKGRRKEDIIF